MSEKDPFFEKLLTKKTSLEKLIDIVKKDLERAPEGNLRIVKTDSRTQYYLITSEHDTNGKYLPKSQEELAKKIAQRDYNKKVLAELEKEYTFVERMIKSYKKDAVLSVYENLSEGRRELVTPVIPTAGQFVKEWQQMSYQKNSASQNAQIVTESGISVRSKSEELIANSLFKEGIPFRYEFPVQLESINQIFYPNFYCLNVRTHEEFVWEHFSIMDDPDYSDAVVKKICIYNANGFIQGKNLITTFETINTPLDAQTVNTLIENFLK